MTPLAAVLSAELSSVVGVVLAFLPLRESGRALLPLAGKRWSAATREQTLKVSHPQ